MTGRDHFATQFFGALVKRVELDELVATRAGIRRASAAIFLDEIIDDARVELFLHIQDIIRNIQNIGDAARVFSRADGAATAKTMRRERVIFAAPQLHRDADNFITLLD